MLLLPFVVFGKVKTIDIGFQCQYTDINGIRRDSFGVGGDFPYATNMKEKSSGSIFNRPKDVKIVKNLNLVSFSSKLAAESITVQPVIINTVEFVGEPSTVAIVDCGPFSKKKSKQCLTTTLKSSYTYKGVYYALECITPPSPTDYIPDFATNGVVDFGIIQFPKNASYHFDYDLPTINGYIKGFGKFLFKDSLFISAETIKVKGKIVIRVIRKDGVSCDFNGQFVGNRWTKVFFDHPATCEFDLLTFE